MTIWLAIATLLLVSLILLVIFSGLAAKSQGRKPALFWGSIVLSVIVSLALYREYGAEPELSLRDKMDLLAQQAEENPDASRENAIELVRALEDATERYPDKAEYWYMLANQQMSLQHYREAADAFAGARQLFPEDMSLLASQTEAEYLASEYRLTDAVRSLIDQVLAVEPNNATINGILGITAYRGAQFDAAARFWERALSSLPPMSSDAQTMRTSIDQARIMLAQQSGGVPDALAEQPEDVSAPAGPALNVEVSLAGDLSVPPQTTLFVFVRQAGGPPMPVVVERTSAGALPQTFVMDDSKVMIQGRSLADFPSLEVVARISFSGQPTAQSGDYEAIYGPISLADQDAPVSLVIADKIP